MMQQPVSIKSEPDWNDLLLPEPDGRQYGLHPQQQLHYNPQLPPQPQQHHPQQQQHPMQQSQQQPMRNGNHPVSLQQAQQPPPNQQQQPQQQPQQPLSNDPVDNEPLDIIENVDSDDNDFAEAESLTLQQYKVSVLLAFPIVQSLL